MDELDELTSFVQHFAKTSSAFSCTTQKAQLSLKNRQFCNMSPKEKIQVTQIEVIHKVLKNLCPRTENNNYFQHLSIFY
jgi:hypothetical protein